MIGMMVIPLFFMVAYPLVRYHFTEQNPVIVIVDDYEVYRGPSACIEASSYGPKMASVKIKVPPFCLKTIASYVTDSLIIKPDIDQMILDQEPRNAPIQK